MPFSRERMPTICAYIIPLIDSNDFKPYRAYFLDHIPPFQRLNPVHRTSFSPANVSIEAHVQATCMPACRNSFVDNQLSHRHRFVPKLKLMSQSQSIWGQMKRFPNDFVAFPSHFSSGLPFFRRTQNSRVWYPNELQLKESNGIFKIIFAKEFAKVAFKYFDLSIEFQIFMRKNNHCVAHQVPRASLLECTELLTPCFHFGYFATNCPANLPLLLILRPYVVAPLFHHLME